MFDHLLLNIFCHFLQLLYWFLLWWRNSGRCRFLWCQRKRSSNKPEPEMTEKLFIKVWVYPKPSSPTSPWWIRLRFGSQPISLLDNLGPAIFTLEAGHSSGRGHLRALLSVPPQLHHKWPPSNLLEGKLSIREAAGILRIKCLVEEEEEEPLPHWRFWLGPTWGSPSSESYYSGWLNWYPGTENIS